MNANPKIALSAIALAALVVGPAAAKARTHAPAYDNGYHNGRVVVGGRVVGTDPDPNIRIQIRRDWNWWEE